MIEEHQLSPHSANVSLSNNSSTGLAFIDAISDLGEDRKLSLEAQPFTESQICQAPMTVKEMKASGYSDDYNCNSASDKPTSNLSPAELESSLKVRQKYGLLLQKQQELIDDNDSASNRLHLEASESSILVRNSSPSYEALFQSIDEQLANFPDINSKISPRSVKTKRFYAKEVASIRGMIEIVVRMFMDELVTTGNPVENEHPLLPVLAALIELFLYHGWQGNSSLILWNRPTVWSLIEKIDGFDNGLSASAIENVRQFTTLRTSAARIKAWIQLALMNKCLGPDLKKLLKSEDAFLRDNYEEWACIRNSSAKEEIPKLLIRMDNVDFNLYVQEQNIPKGDFAVNWEDLFMSDRIDLTVLDPPVSLPDGFICSNSNVEISTPTQKSKSPSLVDFEELLITNRKLREENHRLRRSLVIHLDQRAFHEEMAAKTSARLASLQTSYNRLLQLYKSVMENEAREKTIVIQSPQSSNTATSCPLPEPKNSNCRWRMREKELIEQLRVAVALKDEYRKRLKERISENPHSASLSLPDLAHCTLSLTEQPKEESSDS